MQEIAQALRCRPRRQRKIAEQADGVQVGPQFVVQVGRDPLAGLRDHASLANAVNQNDDHHSAGEHRRQPGQARHVGFLPGIAPIKFCADQRTLTFQFVPQRQLVQPRANGQDCAVEIPAIGQAGEGTGGIFGLKVGDDWSMQRDIAAIRK